MSTHRLWGRNGMAAAPTGERPGARLVPSNESWALERELGAGAKTAVP